MAGRFQATPGFLGTQGSIPHVGADGKLIEDNPNLFWDDTNNRLGIGTDSPNSIFEVRRSGAGEIARLSTDANSVATIGFYKGTTSQVGKITIDGQADLSFDLMSVSSTGPLVLGTVNVERMRIDASGNVGIGVTDPDAKLEINGQLKITGGSPQNGRFLRSDAEGLAVWGDVGWTDLGTDVVLQNSSNNVGIGTATPNTKLDVTGNSGTAVGGFASGALHVTSPSADVNANAVITGHNLNGGNKQLWYLGSTASANDNIGFINRQNADLSFSTNSVERIKIEAAGNVIHTNFTKLGIGAPIVKMKKLTSTTGATEGDTTIIAHGLTLSKIIGLSVLVTADNSNLIPPALVLATEFEYDTFLTPTDVTIRLSNTNSGNLLGNAITVLLTYEE